MSRTFGTALLLLSAIAGHAAAATAAQNTAPAPQHPLQTPRQPRPDGPGFQMPTTRINPPYHPPMTVNPVEGAAVAPAGLPKVHAERPVSPSLSAATSRRVATLPRPARPSHRQARHRARRRTEKP